MSNPKIVKSLGDVLSDSLENWVLYNPIIPEGVLAIVNGEGTVRRRFKIGQNNRHFNDLPWMVNSADASTVEYARLSMPGDVAMEIQAKWESDDTASSSHVTEFMVSDDGYLTISLASAHIEDLCLIVHVGNCIHQTLRTSGSHVARVMVPVRKGQLVQCQLFKEKDSTEPFKICALKADAITASLNVANCAEVGFSLVICYGSNVDDSAYNRKGEVKLLTRIIDESNTTLVDLVPMKPIFIVLKFDDQRIDDTIMLRCNEVAYSLGVNNYSEVIIPTTSIMTIDNIIFSRKSIWVDIYQ